MILSSTARSIIPASNTGRCGRSTGNGRSCRSPGRNTFATDLCRGRPAVPTCLRGAKIRRIDMKMIAMFHRCRRFGGSSIIRRIGVLLAASCILCGCTLPRTQASAPGTSFRDCSDGCPEMVVVPQGTFTMGAPAGEESPDLPDRLRGHSVPQHVVTIGYKLAIAKYDVTRDEYAQFVAETNRPDPDNCIVADPSAGFIAKPGKCQPDPDSCITVNAAGN